MPEELKQLVAELELAIEANTATGAELDEQLIRGNRILRRKTLWIIATCVSVALDVIVTVVLGILGYQLHNTQHDATATEAALRVNTCNLNTLFAQSIRNSGNTVDLYKGLRPLLAESSDPSSRAAVRFIDGSIANITSNAQTRTDFLRLTQDTAKRLHCPTGFITK